MSGVSDVKHTPGPWALKTVTTSVGICHKIGPFPSNGAREETHACVYADNVRSFDLGHSKVGDELLANARLIAAAPELLEAARAASDYLAELYAKYGAKIGPFSSQAQIHNGSLRSAIAKAEGRS